MLDVQQIKDIIPHRYAFLLVDQVVKKKSGQRDVTLKNVTANELFIEEYIHDYPVMPGVLILEALAQTGAIDVLEMEKNKGKIGFLAGVDKCRFKREVKPGDQLRLEVEIIRMKGP